MRLFACCLFTIICVAVPVLAQDNPSDVHQSTTPPAGARFEIIQSELAARWTFKLDRFTGQIFQFVKAKDGDPEWQEMEVVGRSSGLQATRARFQIFTSGIAARFTFLIDTDTGKTWQLSTSKQTLADGTVEETDSWESFP